MQKRTIQVSEDKSVNGESAPISHTKGFAITVNGKQDELAALTP